MELSGKVVLITGGARMGASLAHACAAQGADVALSYSLSGAVIAEVVARVEATGRRSAAFHADLRDPGGLPVTRRRRGRVGGTARRARVPGVGVRARADRRADARHLARATRRRSRRVLPLRARRRGPHAQRGAGHIVLCSDWVAASGRPRYTGYVPYYVAKAGVVALTEALALELAPHRIQVNAIAPGPILPAARDRPRDAGRVIAGHAAGPLGRPDVDHPRRAWACSARRTDGRPVDGGDTRSRSGSGIGAEASRGTICR